MRLWCGECCRPEPPKAKGWRMLRVDVPEDDDEPIVAVYCLYCAEREFGMNRRADQPKPSRDSQGPPLRSAWGPTRCAKAASSIRRLADAVTYAAHQTCGEAKGGLAMLTAEEYKQAEFGLTVEESRRGFKIHATVYAVVITGLIVLNALLWAYTEDGRFPWVIFPIVCWGIGLTFHWFYGYRRPEPQIRARQRQVEKYAEQTKQPV